MRTPTFYQMNPTLSVWSHVTMKAQIYYPPSLRRMLYLPTHSALLREMCSSYASLPVPLSTLLSASTAEVGRNLPPLQWKQQH